MNTQQVKSLFMTATEFIGWVLGAILVVAWPVLLKCLIDPA